MIRKIRLQLGKKTTLSKTYLPNFLSVIEEILVLLITGLSYSFTLFLSRYSTFSVLLFGCFSLHIYSFSVSNQLAFYRMCHKPAYNQICFEQTRDTFDEKKSLVLHFLIDSVYTKDQTEALKRKMSKFFTHF